MALQQTGEAAQACRVFRPNSFTLDWNYYNKGLRICQGAPRWEQQHDCELGMKHSYHLYSQAHDD